MSSSARTKYQLSLPPQEVKPVAPPAVAEDKPLVLKRALLRAAIDESGWKHDAIAAALGVDGPYLSKMLAGDKPITLRHLDALPDDVEARYSQKYAEAMGGIVVAPAPDHESAVRDLVRGLVGVLGGRKVGAA